MTKLQKVAVFCNLLFSIFMLITLGNLAWLFATCGWFVVMTQCFGNDSLNNIIKSEIEKQYADKYLDFIEETTEQLEDATDEMVKKHYLFQQQKYIIDGLVEIRKAETQAIINGVDDILEYHDQYKTLADIAVGFSENMEEDK